VSSLDGIEQCVSMLIRHELTVVETNAVCSHRQARKTRENLCKMAATSWLKPAPDRGEIFYDVSLVAAYSTVTRWNSFARHISNHWCLLVDAWLWQMWEAFSLKPEKV